MSLEGKLEVESGFFQRSFVKEWGDFRNKEDTTLDDLSGMR